VDIEIDEYRANLEARVSARTHEFDGEFDVPPTEFRETAFTEVALEALLDLGQVPDIQPCFFSRTLGRYAVKVNGWAFEEESGEVDLVTTLYSGRTGLDAIPPAEIRKAVSRAARVVAEAHRGIHKEMEPASPAWDMMQTLYQGSADVSRVRVVVLTDATTKDVGGLDEEFDFEVQADVWDLTRMFRAEASGLPYEPIEIDIEKRLGRPLPCVLAPAASPEYDVYLTLIPGVLLHDLYHEFGPRLLELNVRSFLQARGQVNKGIRDTLKNESARFLAYNNGISITAEEVDLFGSDTETPQLRRIVGMQVVNGGQTVASIHRAKNRDGVDLSPVSVQAKIAVIHGGKDVVEELVPFISKYANTQNRVNEADFSANHPFHVRIQQLSSTIWAPGEQHRWFYERARGQYDVARGREGTTPARQRKFDEVTPRSQKFDKVFLAKCQNAWDQLPHTVSQGGQKNFVAFMKRLKKEHSAGWVPDPEYYKDLIAKAIIFKEAEKAARRHKFSGYRANAVAYTIAALSYRTAGRVNLRAIWEAQEVSDALSRTIFEWMGIIHQQLITSAGRLNVTEWCKKEECWRHIQTTGIPVPSDLEAELSAGQPLPTVGKKAGSGAVGLGPVERENIARVMQRSADDWIHLCKWGAQTNLLKPWQIGIAGTLATYSARGWMDVPSAKQAAQGIKMLEIADENGAWREEEE